MSLRGRGSKKSIVRGGNISVSDTPIKNTSLSTEKEVDFKNASPSKDNSLLINDSVDLQTKKPVSVADHPTMASGVITPIFLGNPTNPTKEFIYTNPYVFDNSQFYPEDSVSCAKVFLFANITPKRRSDSGIYVPKQNTGVPAGPDERRLPTDYQNNYQVIFVNQDIFDDTAIQINGIDLIMKTSGVGVPVIHHERLEIETWYN